MQFKVSRDVLDLNLKVICLVINDLDNKQESAEFIKFKPKAYEALKEKYVNFDIETDLILKGYHKLHRKIGVKRKKNTPISEKILKSFLKGEIPITNKLTDLYNIVTLDSRLSIGMYDMSKLVSPVTLTIVKEKMNYNFEGNTIKTLHSGEYIYTDKNGLISRLEVNQNPKTIVTENTKDILVIIEGNEDTSAEYIMEVADEIISLITSYCGGKANIIYK